MAGRSLHCGTARTKKYFVFLTFSKNCSRIKSQLLLAVYSLTELGLLPSYARSGLIRCGSNKHPSFTVKNLFSRLVKINHVILVYLSTGMTMRLFKVDDWMWVVCLQIHPRAGNTMNEKFEKCTKRSECIMSDFKFILLPESSICAKAVGEKFFAN